MSTGHEKLNSDLEILEAMAAEMADYLMGETLYWQMAQGEMPKLTLGGYLLRQHRLQHLWGLLNDDERDRLAAAVTQFNDALVERVVRTEKRAHEEVGVRTRQWEAYVREVQREAALGAVNYETAVENRAMLSALIDFLQNEPFQLEPKVNSSVRVVDQGLRNHWRAGDFVWPEAWQSAYPKDTYWWLYGRPK